MSRVFSYCIKVRYPEVDQMRIVYHGNYIPWLELARTNVITQFGFSYRMMEERGIFVPVTDLVLSYKKPAQYDDRVVVLVSVSELRSIRVSFTYEVRRINNLPVAEGGGTLSEEQIDFVRNNNDLLLTATSHHVFMNSENQVIRLDRVAPDFFEVLKGITEGFQKY